MKHYIIICAFMMTLVACTDSDPRPPQPLPDHQLFQGLEAPPLNKPLRPVAIKPEDITPALPRDEQAAILVTQNDKAFAGELQRVGSVTVEADSITFEPGGEGVPLRIRYRLPQGMSPLPAIRGAAQLQLRALSSPAGADQLVILTHMERLLFSEVWQRAVQPLRIKLHDNLYLVQAPTPELARVGYTQADVALYEGEKLLAQLPLGKALPVESSAGTLQVYVETSHHFIPTSADAEQYPEEYILRAWLVRPGEMKPANEQMK